MAFSFSGSRPNDVPLLLDGGMGSYIASFGLSEADYSGGLEFEKPQLNNNDLLPLTNPEVITRIHREYLRAGADIVTACSFCAVRPMQLRRGAAERTYDMALAAAKTAKAAALEFSAPERPRYAAGSVGPTDRPLSIVLADSDADADELISELRLAYEEQISALVEGGVDLLLLETFFDPINAKAAVDAARNVFGRAGRSVPVAVSATVGGFGRLLTGETPEQFFAKLPPVDAYSLNCGSPEELIPAAREFTPRAGGVPFGFYPNAGLPDDSGRYSLSPESFAAQMSDAVRELRPAFVGGCCGTTPEHIAALAARLGK